MSESCILIKRFYYVQLLNNVATVGWEFSCGMYFHYNYSLGKRSFQNLISNPKVVM